MASVLEQSIGSTPPTPITANDNGNQASPTASNEGQQVSTHGPNNGDYRVVRKRNRVPLSCAPCRTRKLKCNRSHPCENCVKRGDAASCSYASPSDRRKASSRSSGSSTPDDMQNRIDRLENLVLTMMNHGNDAPPGPGAVNRTLSMSTATGSGSGSGSAADFNSPSQPDDSFQSEDGESETDKVTNSFGVLHFQNNKAAYLGEAHWASILHDISEVKNYFTEHKKQYEDAMRKVEASKNSMGGCFTGPAFVLGGRAPPKLSEILGSLPGRDAVDKLVERYFSSYDSTAQIMHTPSWKRAYENHWNDAGSTTSVFLGQLYAICGLAMQSYHRDSDEPPEYRGRTLSLANNYRMLTQQCMLLFDINKVEHAIVETYVLHMQSEFYKAGDVDIGVWVLLGIVVRLAMRMGLHRDSQHYSSLSPFQGEMRRRLWTYIHLGDTLFSFQVGLPSMIRSSDCDTQLPLNLHDEDFDEHSESLPSARPATVLTKTSYMIAKASLAGILGRIVECTHSVRPQAYEGDIMRLHNELLGTFQGLPPNMRMKSLDESDLDPPTMVVARYHLASLFHKSLCVLHRKFLTRARENSRYASSRRFCMDAALTLLRYHVVLHDESQPGRRLAKAYLGALSHLKHDFILAGTLVCLDLFQSAQLEAAGRPSGDVDLWGRDLREDMTGAIEASRAIWAEQRDRTIEAFKAYEIAGIMLRKIAALRAQNAARVARGAVAYAANGANGAAAGAGAGANASPSPGSGGGFRRAEDPKPEQAAALTLGMLSSGGMAGKPAGFNGPYAASPASNGSPPQAADVPAATASSPPTGFGFAPLGNGNFNPSGLPFLAPDMEMPANFDWTALDAFISNNFSPPNEAWPQNMDMSGPPVDGPPGTSVPAPLDPALPPFNQNSPFANGNPSGFSMGPSL